MKTRESWRDRLVELVAKARNQGFVTYDEISRIFADTVVDPEEIETVLGLFGAAGVPVVDSADVPMDSLPSAQEGDRRSNDDDWGALDPVEAYMRDIERLLPLPAEEEDVLLRQMAEGLALLAEAVLNTEQGRAQLSAAVATNQKVSHAVGRERVAALSSSGRRTEAPSGLFAELSDAGIAIADLENAASDVPISDDTLLSGRTKLEDARKRLVEGHIRLVPYLARRHSNRGVEYLDLVQEGNTGLVRAAKRFNPLKGQRFATYATWWIRQAMTSAINEQGRAVRIPKILMKERKRLNRAREKLRQELGREPTRSELAAALGLDIDRVHRLIDMTKSVLRLDHPSGESDSLPLGEVIDIGSGDWTGTPLFQLMKRELEEVLSSLDPPEQEVMKLRFGLDDDEPCTLAEICKRLQMSKDRVRRIEAKALLKLRHPEQRERLLRSP